MRLSAFNNTGLCKLEMVVMVNQGGNYPSRLSYTCTYYTVKRNDRHSEEKVCLDMEE